MEMEKTELEKNISFKEKGNGLYETKYEIVCQYKINNNDLKILHYVEDVKKIAEYEIIKELERQLFSFFDKKTTGRYYAAGVPLNVFITPHIEESDSIAIVHPETFANILKENMWLIPPSSRK